MIKYSPYTAIKSIRIPDPDSLAFISAIENDNTSPTILTTLEKSAIDDLVIDLKANGLWTKYKAFYPFITDTWDACKYNLKDPRDLDAAFRLAKINEQETNFYYIAGIVAYQALVNSFLVLGTDLQKDDYHISFASNGHAEGYLAGATSGTARCLFAISPTSMRIFTDSHNENDFSLASDTTGYYQISVKSGRQRVFKNETRLTDTALASGGSVSSNPLGLFSVYDGTGRMAGSGVTFGRFTCFGIGFGLTDAEAVLANTIITKYLTKIGRYITTNNDLMTLANTGTKAPSTTDNQYLQKFMSFKLGGLISYSMYTWTLSPPWPASPNLFYKGTHDIDKWVSDAKDAGIKYLVLTVFDNSQFALFDNPIPFPDYILNTVFGHRKYDIASAGGDTAIVDKFFTACQKYGIEPIPYMCPVFGANLCRTQVPAGTAKTIQGGYTSTEIQYFENHFCKVMQYILTTWNPSYLWMDVAGGAVYNNMQLIYDSAKAINPNIQIMANTVGDNPFQWFPYDIGADEEFFSLTALPPPGKTWADVLSPFRVKNGTTYLIRQEIVTNNFSGGAGRPYYWSPSQTLRIQSEVQNMYNIAKANGVNLLFNLAPNRSGVIPSEQFDLFKNLVL